MGLVDILRFIGLDIFGPLYILFFFFQFKFGKWRSETVHKTQWQKTIAFFQRESL